MKKITAIIPTFNEQHNIAGAIDSVSWADRPHDLSLFFPTLSWTGVGSIRQTVERVLARSLGHVLNDMCTISYSVLH